MRQCDNYGFICLATCSLSVSAKQNFIYLYVCIFKLIKQYLQQYTSIIVRYCLFKFN